MHPTCAATGARSTAPAAAIPVDTPTAVPAATSAPQLRSSPAESVASLIPDDLVQLLMGRLAPADLVASSRVCLRWHAVAKSTQWIESLRIIDGDATRNALSPISVETFGNYLSHARFVGPGCRAEVLGRTAARLPFLPAGGWEQCLCDLLGEAQQCAAPDFPRLLGAITAALLWPPGLVNFENSQPMSALSLVKRMIWVARPHPVAAQATVLAAACRYIACSSSGASQIQDEVVRCVSAWTDRQLQGEDEHGLARRLKQAVASCTSPDSLLVSLAQFNLDCLPFMADADAGHKTQAEIIAHAGAILRSGRSRREQVVMLQHRDHFGRPWLWSAVRNGAAGQICAYLRAMHELGLSASELATICAARQPNGRPLLSWLVSEEASCIHRRKKDTTLERSLSVFIAMVEECGLPHPETVALLRSEFRACPESSVPDTSYSDFDTPDFELGPGRARPFAGLSLIDSLFCDWLCELMALYMEKILASGLPDAVKCDALRLAYPDRSNFLRMGAALREYGRQIRSSALPMEMKLALTQPLRVHFEPACALL